MSATSRALELAQANDGDGVKFQIVGYEEISITNIEPHPNNPRPKFHTTDDDPHIRQLGESIKTQGQHHPALVYELKDKPGYYRLLQGERRWRACRAVGVDKLRCFIAKTPDSESEELGWLGIEEAFKLDWQPFFVLKYAWDLSAKLDVPVTHSEMTALTGLAPKDLRMADKVFRLEPEIQALCAEYEEYMYEQYSNGHRRKGTRLTGSGVRTQEFPVQKAALVWDIFEALRINCRLMVKETDDLELQRLIAARATRNGATVRDLELFHASVRAAGKEPPSGLLTEIADLLRNPTRSFRDVNRATGRTEIGKLTEFIKKSEALRKLAEFMVRNIEQCGTDAASLAEVEHAALLLARDANELERAFRQRREETKEQR
ncbi:MAG TPA: ParB N-terminal domain-containing protein [Nitrososphaera sp.]|nr:ParB N-terminal domain-containing protein [Nitrososphaera sp.]